ncbi:MAG: hypothetical protein JXB13_16250 [Phycisphaerae bacterium]|nr:hypothetical protein [Phycisphaerae bacterium]
MWGKRIIRGLASTLIATAPAVAVDFSVWADRQYLPAAGLYLAHNSITNCLFIETLGGPLLEWPEGAITGTELVPAGNWTGCGCPVFVPARGTYLVADERGILEVLAGVSGQNPPLLLDLTTDPGRPEGGFVQDGHYAYYKYQVSSPTDQSIHRIPLAGPVVDTEHVPFSAVLAAGGNAISLQITMDRSRDLYISLRGNHPQRGIYRWDETTTGLVPVMLQPQIIAYTGQSLAAIYGLTVDPQDVFYFYEIYSSSILSCNRSGQLGTFATHADIRAFMDDPGLSISVSWILPVGRRLVFTTGNVSGHVLTARITPWYSDFDDDGDSDDADYQVFAARITGPVEAPAPGDEPYDYDGDAHVDLRDYSHVQRLFAIP